MLAETNIRSALVWFSDQLSQLRQASTIHTAGQSFLGGVI